MISPSNIHPPKNWQDFETLCLKLWGEIWNIPDEIEFNSDNSQGQHGVDVYGPVDEGRRYNGIQCKNKKLNLIDGRPNRISISDISAEIDKAKGFKPPLNKLVIATSLLKDQKIEEYVRIASVENVEAGLFSIQICFWEFFERKLPEFPKVYDWYLKNEDFYRIASSKVTFSDGDLEKTYIPKFQRTIDRYVLHEEQSVQQLIAQSRRDLLRVSWLENNRYEWHQQVWFKLSILNSGQSVIEDFKLELDFQGDFQKVGSESPSPIFAPNFKTDVREYSNTEKSLYIKPFDKALVQEDSYNTGFIFLVPSIAKSTDIIIQWRLLARNFDDSGALVIKIRPKYHTVVKTHNITDPQQEEKEVVTYSLIKRPATINVLGSGTKYLDNESDYNFE